MINWTVWSLNYLPKYKQKIYTVVFNRLCCSMSIQCQTDTDGLSSRLCFSTALNIIHEKSHSSGLCGLYLCFCWWFNYSCYLIQQINQFYIFSLNIKSNLLGKFKKYILYYVWRITVVHCFSYGFSLPASNCFLVFIRVY